jgi:carbon monoxide dehydrogenase subunit G
VELTGDSLIAADRHRVWTALNDPAVLARCIDGVESLAATSDAGGATRFDGTMNARVGPIRATFAGGVTLTEVDPPNRYVLVGEGKGGVAGFAKGSAEVTLIDAVVDDRAGTRLHYVVTSSVGGKLAQLGARLIEGTARGYADTFFARLKAEVETPDDLPATPDADAAPAAPAAPAVPGTATDAQHLHGSRKSTGLTPLVWCTIIVLVVLAVLVWQLA